MKKIVALSTLRAELTGTLSLQLTGTTASLAYAGMADNEITGSIGRASNSSATAVITSTVSPVSLPDE